MKNIFFALALVLVIGCTKTDAVVTTSVSDIDGNVYPAVTIGKQTWTKTNLNVTQYNDGTLINEAQTDEEWAKAARDQAPAWCSYNRDSANDSIYGKLYNWYAVVNRKGLAPEGWHVPAKSEWEVLINTLGTNAALKMIDVSGSNVDNWAPLIATYVPKTPEELPDVLTKMLNKSKFTAVPVGFRSSSGRFFHEFRIAYWWTSTEADDDSYAWCRSLGLSNCSTYDNKRYGFSIRCLKD